MNRRLSKKASKQAKQYVKSHRVMKKWHKVVAVMGALVVVGTAAALTLPAVTKQSETYCGLEEHVHSDECYQVERTLICELSEEGHQHCDECWAEKSVLICGKEETDGHTHNDECYTEEDVQVCTIPESDGHTHDDICYTEQDVLTCTIPETDGHTHNEECYELQAVLVCTDTDPDHVHDDECYEQQPVLICGQEECEAHHHDAECYEKQPVLTCGQEESEGHHHDADCYEKQRVLSCGQEEVEAHHHDESCFRHEKELICGLEESEPHEHTDACYEEKINTEIIICGQEEHEHTLQCFSNPNADVESASTWENVLSRVELTGNWPQDVIAIAESQLGYAESTANYEVQEDGITMKGYTRYGDWYGIPYGDWCAMFASFCINYAHVENYPIEAACWRYVNNLKELGLYHENDGYTPKPGDLLFYDFDSIIPDVPRDADHVGIVTEVILGDDPSTTVIKTIEGNWDERVTRVERRLDFASILGFGEMKQNPEFVAEKVSVVPECDCGVNNPDHLDWHADSCARKSYVRELCDANTAADLSEMFDTLPEDVKAFALIYLSWGQNAKLDELNALLAAKPVVKNASDGDMTVAVEGHFPADAQPSIENISGEQLALLDSFLSGNLDNNGTAFSSGAVDISIRKNGAEWEPDESMSVTLSGITLPSCSVGQLQVRVFHLKQTDISALEGLEAVQPEVEELPAVLRADGSIAFSTDSFSVFYYVVNFRLNDITTSLVGGDTTLLSSLFGGLGMDFDPSEIVSVVFSNPALLEISPVYREDGVTVLDWRIVSLASFETNEMLTVTFRNGEVMNIAVTDPNNWIVRTWNGSYSYGYASFVIPVYVVPVDENGNETAAIPNNATANYNGLVNGNYFEPAATFTQIVDLYMNSNPPINGSFYNAYFLSGSTKEKDNVSKVYISNNTIGIQYTDSSGNIQDQSGYISDSCNRALVIQYIPYVETEEVAVLEPKAPDHYKFIDAFRDEDDNPDTDLDDKARDGEVEDDIFDLYRLYLTLGPESSYNGVDVLFVLDRSSSMTSNKDATDIGNHSGLQRRSALNSMLNGLGDNNGKAYSDNNYNNSSKLEPDGLISMLYRMNPKNKVAAVWFNANSGTIYGWDYATHAVTDNTSAQGTNYMAGLDAAEQLLDASSIQNDGNEKVVIFLSDGLPTEYNYIDSQGNKKVSSVCSLNPSSSRYDANLRPYTEGRIREFRAKYDGKVSIYSIAIGSDFDTAFLSKISTSGAVMTASDFGTVLNVIDSKITRFHGHYDNLVVTDTLSDYVDFYMDDLDLVVDMYDTVLGENSPMNKTLYKNNKIQDDGKDIIQSVTLNESDKTVTVVFQPSYQEEGGIQYRVHFNVKTTQYAYDEYSDNLEDGTYGYGAETYMDTDGNLKTRQVQGNPLTDYYSVNHTSSEKPGFHSNAEATLSFDQFLIMDEEPLHGEEPYDDPVIQVKDQAEIPEPDLIEKHPDHQKYIDSFRDGTENPETTLDNKAKAGQLPDDTDLDDLYRLYLTLGPESSYKAVDVLFVLDRSSSMATYGSGNDATDIGGHTGVWRRSALNSMLNGLGANNGATYAGNDYNNSSALEDDGLLALMYALNPENQVAAIGFHSNASTILNWGDANRPITDNDSASGTNYMAALSLADQMLNNAPNDGNEKIMVFISDGAPSMYINNQGQNSSIEEWTDQDPNKRPYTNNAIDSFKAAHSDVTIYTVSIGNEIDLSYLWRLSSDNKLLSTSNFKTLMRILDSKITRGVGHYNELTVTDTLSDYVDFYRGEDALSDEYLELVMDLYDPSDPSATIVLFENGQRTDAGEEYIKENGVTVDFDDKTVTVDFQPEAEVMGGKQYRIHFNVKATQQAYDDYVENLADEKPGYGTETVSDGNGGTITREVQGDKHTDRTGNSTSSEKVGFHSNADGGAIITYEQWLLDADPVSGEVEYDHPVIQVNYDVLHVEKVWSDIETETHDDVTITAALYRQRNGEVDSNPVQTVELKKANSWKADFEYLPSGGYSYFVRELNAPANYEVTYTEPSTAKPDTWVITNTRMRADVRLLKTDMSGNAITGSSAKFTLYSDEALTTPVGDPVLTDSDGYATFEDLPLGKIFYLKENRAPNGFNLMDDVASFRLKKDGTNVVIEYLSPDNQNVAVDGTDLLLLRVKNSDGYELPKTGGTGTLPVYAFGAMLLAAALVLGCNERRRRGRRSEQ